MDLCVFIHTNDRQYIGALVSQYALKRNSTNSDKFQAKILHTDDHPFLKAKEGKEFLRNGKARVWRMDDLQSFTPLRFMPPQAMGYQGRAVVIDPDVFAVGDIYELLTRDMDDKAIMCRPRSGTKGAEGGLATSVMLLDCAKLSHWRGEQDFGALFAFERDYADWITLKLEDRSTIGLIEREWNDFDNLTPETKLLHNTKRQTQPWKTGLPVDFTPADKRIRPFKPKTWFAPFKKSDPKTYSPHPDPNQEQFFFGLLRECLDQGVIAEEQLRDAMKDNFIRHDAFEVLDRTTKLAA